MHSNLATKPQLSDHQIQQRQILKLMGINVWVSRTSSTQSFDESNMGTLSIDSLATQAELNNNETSYNPQMVNEPIEMPSMVDAPVMAIQPSANSTHHPVVSRVLNHQQVPDNSFGAGYSTIRAFNLVGARYKAWVLLVDTTAFETPQLAELWNNIVTALALTTQDISFPFCNQMHNQAVANACLAGFIFRIAEREDTQVAVLSELPEGLSDERIVEVPKLSDMLEDSQLKQQFWELIR